MAHSAELRRLRDDIHTLDASVHQDIYELIPKDIVSQNGNGAFFDVCQLTEDCLENVKSVVQYAKAVRGKLEDHDRKMFENAQQLVSGPIETDVASSSAPNDEPNKYVALCDGEEAFCTRMENGCITKPAKGVFVKK